MTITARPSPDRPIRFRVAHLVFAIRDTAIAEARRISRQGATSAVVREEGYEKRIIGEARAGVWYWAKDCAACAGTGRSGPKLEFSCAKCAGAGVRVA
jgi:hypothetical protein